MMKDDDGLEDIHKEVRVLGSFFLRKGNTLVALLHTILHCRTTTTHVKRRKKAQLLFESRKERK